MSVSRFPGLLLSGVLLLCTACSPEPQSDTAGARKPIQTRGLFANPKLVNMADAIQADDVDQMLALIKQGVDLNASDANQRGHGLTFDQRAADAVDAKDSVKSQPMTPLVCPLWSAP